MKRFIPLLLLLLTASSVFASENSTAEEERLIELIKGQFGDYIIFENDEGIILIDPKYDPRRVYDQNPKRSFLTNRILQDHMEMMGGDVKTLVALFLIIKKDSFTWWSGLRFEALIHRKGRLIAALPAERTFYGLIRGVDEPEWIYLGEGASQVLVPRTDRIIPTRFRSLTRIYRIYLLFPATIRDGDTFRTWNPFKIKEVEIRPTATTSTAAAEVQATVR